MSGTVHLLSRTGKQMNRSFTVERSSLNKICPIVAHTENVLFVNASGIYVKAVSCILKETKEWVGIEVWGAQESAVTIYLI